MEAYRIDRFGSVDGIVLRSSEDPRPGPKEILMRVRASSLNYRDLMVLPSLAASREERSLRLPCGRFGSWRPRRICGDKDSASPRSVVEQVQRRARPRSDRTVGTRMWCGELSQSVGTGC